MPEVDTETSGTAFFTYAIAWGVNNGILDDAKYRPIIRKAWRGLTGAVSDEGRLQWVQPVGDRSRNVSADMTHEYAVGAFLLAASEMLKLEP
ncbi:glycoside hydrolase family 88 protein [Planctomycetota bacterium]